MDLFLKKLVFLEKQCGCNLLDVSLKIAGTGYVEEGGIS